MFLGEHASDALEVAIIDRTAVVQTPHAAAISGAPTVDASAWDSSKNGENKQPTLIK